MYKNNWTKNLLMEKNRYKLTVKLFFYPEPAGLTLNWICKLPIGPIGSDVLMVTSKSPLAKNVAIDWDASGTSTRISWIFMNPDTILNGQVQSMPMLNNCG